ncbi:MAG: hypothetical protein ACJ71M_16975 [Nitrososphaeraceae archaeon]
MSSVGELSSQGYSQGEIAQILKVSDGTVNRDLSILMQQAKENIKLYINERLHTNQRSIEIIYHT